MKSKPTHYKVYFQETPEDPSFYTSCAKDSFETLWQSINGPESWDLNPFVWVVSFEVVSKTGKPLEQKTNTDEIKRLAHEALPKECIAGWNEFKFCHHRLGDGNMCKLCSNYI